MNDNRKTLLQHMDSWVEWTGIPRFARQETRMRRLKWIPIVLLQMSAAGVIVTFAAPQHPLWGSMLQTWAMCLSAAIVQLGPLRPTKEAAPSDERDELWRARSNLFAYATVSILAMISIFGLATYSLWCGLVMQGAAPDLSYESLGYRMISLASVLFVLFMTLPTLHASWTMPEIIEDEPEEDDRARFLRSRQR